jgi:hypothetical protein
VRIEVVHRQVDSVGGRVLHRQVAGEPREFQRRIDLRWER